MSGNGVDEAWLAEQGQAAANELIDRYGWKVESITEGGMDQDTIVRMLVAAGWTEGFKYGLHVTPEDDTA